jgi:hypothetical protein
VDVKKEEKKRGKGKGKWGKGRGKWEIERWNGERKTGIGEEIG